MKKNGVKIKVEQSYQLKPDEWFFDRKGEQVPIATVIWNYMEITKKHYPLLVPGGAVLD